MSGSHHGTIPGGIGVLLLLCVCCYTQPTPDPREEERWLFIPRNVHTVPYANEVIARIRQAKADGFTGVVLTDPRFMFPEVVGPHYADLVRRVAAAAHGAQIELIPQAVSFAAAGSILIENPDLAAGLPVRGAPFRVRGGVAVPEPEARIANGSFETLDSGGLAGWEYLRDPAIGFESNRPHSGQRALRISAGGPRSVVGQRLVLPPWRQYRLGIWIATRNVRVPRHVQVSASTHEHRVLNQWPRIQREQGWTRYQLVFNSMEGGETTFLIDARNAEGGTVLVDDVVLEPAGLLNVLRREDAPVLVRQEDGALLVEGQDYEPIRDPMLGRAIRRHHTISTEHAPPVIRLRGETKEGMRLYVSYHHPVVFRYARVSLSLCSPAYRRIVEKGLRSVGALLRPRTIFLSLDEVRLVGYEDACRGRGTAGRILSEAIRHAVAAAHREGGAQRVSMWSDMVDPFQNARGSYYLARGGMEGSWEGLPEDVILVNWNPYDPAKSIPFFAERGFRQIISLSIGGTEASLRRMVQVARSQPGVLGFQYTSWERDYSRVSLFDRLLADSARP